mgnify:CR=1 FL=1
MKKFLLLSLVSASFISLSSNKELQPKEENNGIIRLVSGVAGGIIGGIGGAGTGGVALPGVGTIPGAVVGVAAGFTTGDAIGQAIEHGVKYVTGFDAESFSVKSNLIGELKSNKIDLEVIKNMQNEKTVNIDYNDPKILEYLNVK